METVRESSDGKCASCGYLALLVEIKDPNLNAPPLYREASQWTRDGGHFARVQDPRILSNAVNTALDGAPGCVRGVPIDSEYWSEVKTRDHTGHRAIALAVIQKDRKCLLCTPYLPGFSPKEHLVIRLFEEQDKERRAWELSQEADRRAWINARELQIAKREERENRLMLRLTFVATIVAVVTIFTATPDSPIGAMFTWCLAHPVWSALAVIAMPAGHLGLDQAQIKSQPDFTGCFFARAGGFPADSTRRTAPIQSPSIFRTWGLGPRFFFGVFGGFFFAMPESTPPSSPAPGRRVAFRPQT
jgi:hypothetical protein